jgi:hypothetical protein
VDAGTATLIRTSVSHAFIFGFRAVMLICAALAASAAIAAAMIPAKSGL